MAMPKTAINKTQAFNTIYGFFKQIHNWCNHSITPTVDNLEHYLTRNFRITSNGQLVSKSAADYLSRLETFEQKYSDMVISEPLNEPLIADNRIAFSYKVELTTHTGQRKQVYIMAMATLEGDKISKWDQVAHEKGTGDWDF